MDRVNQSRSGVTIVELMVAILTLSIMVLLVGSMLVIGWQGWYRSNQRVDMQRDATLAMMMISREIRNATIDDITEGAGIGFANGVTFSASGTSIVRDDGIQVMQVVRDSLSSTNRFLSRKMEGVNSKGKTNHWVEVEFDLATSTANEAYSIRVSPRNIP